MNETGGPAFPSVTPAAGGAGPVTYFGMTLRDYFAAKAMQGLFASDTRLWNQEGEWYERAKTAYDMADAMLEARNADKN